MCLAENNEGATGPFALSSIVCPAAYLVIYILKLLILFFFLHLLLHFHIWY